MDNLINRQSAMVLEEAVLTEKREWIEGYQGRWYRKIFYCPSCGKKIRTESWDEKRCFGTGTIMADGTVPKYCPECGLKLKNVYGKNDE